MSTRDELRAIAQCQNLQQYHNAQADRAENGDINPGMIRIGERDPNTGREQVIYPSGGQTLAGVRTFNASLPVGAILRATKPVGSLVVAIDSRSYVPGLEVLAPATPVYPFKILFSVVSPKAGNNDYSAGVTTKFYVGGDRAQPLQIASYSGYVNEGGLNNLGSNRRDFIAGFNFASNSSNTLEAIYGLTGKNWQAALNFSASFIAYRGQGFWQSPVTSIPSFQFYGYSDQVSGDLKGTPDQYGGTKYEIYNYNPQVQPVFYSAPKKWTQYTPPSGSESAYDPGLGFSIDSVGAPEGDLLPWTAGSTGTLGENLLGTVTRTASWGVVENGHATCFFSGTTVYLNPGKRLYVGDKRLITYSGLAELEDFSTTEVLPIAYGIFIQITELPDASNGNLYVATIIPSPISNIKPLLTLSGNYSLIALADAPSAYFTAGAVNYIETNHYEFSTSGTPGYTLPLPACTNDNLGESHSIVTAGSKTHQLTRMEKTINTSGSPESFATLNKNVETRNGLYSLSINYSHRIEHTDITSEESSSFTCSGFSSGTFFDNYWRNWRVGGMLTKTYFDETETADERQLIESAEIAIMPGVYVPYVRQKSKKYHLINRQDIIGSVNNSIPADGSKTPFTEKNNYELTENSSIPEPLIISDKGSLCIYTQEVKYSSTTVDHEASGYLYRAQGFGEPSPVYVSSLTTTKTKNAGETKYYLYNRNSGSSVEIDILPYNFSLYTYARIDIKTGSATFAFPYFISNRNNSLFETIVTNEKQDTISTTTSANVSEQFQSNTVTNPTTNEVTNTVVEELLGYQGVSTLRTSTEKIRTEYVTTPDLFWQQLVGSNVIVSQYVAPESKQGTPEDNGAAVQGYGIVTGYTSKPSGSQYPFDESDLTSISIEIYKVLAVPHDSNADYQAVIVLSNLRILTNPNSFNFVENKNTNSPVKGTLYNFEWSDKDYKNYDAIGYCAAYNIVEVPGSKKLQALRVPGLIKGEIKSLKGKQTTIDQVSSISYYPPKQ